ncbi:response regulator [Candidatus Parcubacteria bacterium]|nr:MAG: response regulator [Candidatus Parcubacteria bacterium]
MAKIVFIEDEPALQQSLGDFLRSNGHEVMAALNGEDGLAMIQKEHPDLVLLDVILPRMNGIEVLRAIRNDPATQATAVIMLTNSEAGETIEEAVRLGAKAYLVKTSYSLDEVSEKVKNVLGA